MTRRVMSLEETNNAIAGLAEEGRMCAAVTGAAGFLASEIARRAVVLGWSVNALDRLPHPGGDSLQRKVVDIRDEDMVAQYFRGCQVVIHAAGLAHRKAMSVQEYFEVNQRGTESVARAAARAGVRRLVLVSSVAVYGSREGFVDEGSRCSPDAPYGCSKLAAEERATEVARSSALELTILRLATVFGEGDPGSVGRLIRAIERRRFVWIGDGHNWKSLVFRDDAASACLVAACGPKATVGTYNVVGSHLQVAELVDTIARETGSRIPSLKIPSRPVLAVTALGRRLTGGRGPMASLHAGLERWLADDRYDGHRFEETFGFSARVGVSEGLRRQVTWGRNRAE